MTVAVEPSIRKFEKMRGVKYVGYDFSGLDLRKMDMRVSIFDTCSFDDADLSEADCTGSSFNGCTFRRSNCYRTNFKDAKLAATVFEPKDCYGMTITMDCKTFQNAQVSQLWFYGLLFFATTMIPALTPVKENLRDRVIALIGAARYVKLTGMFERREL